MGIWEFLKGLIEREKKVSWAGAIVPAQALADPTSVNLVAEKHYFRLWLIEMSLPLGGKWFNDYYPTVQSLVKLLYGPTQQPDLPGIIGPSRLPGVTKDELGRIVQMKLPLTPLLPFKGGTVEIEVGLFASVARDYAQEFLKFLGDVSDTLQLPELSNALGGAGKLVNGLNSFLGAKLATLQTAVHTTFSAGTVNPLRSGYWATFRDEKQQYTDKPDRPNLWVLKNGLAEGATAAAAVPLKDVPYLLIQFEAVTERDDFRQLSFMKTFTDAATASTDELKKQFWIRFYTEVTTSTDLTNADKNRIVTQLKAELDATAGLHLASPANRMEAFLDRVLSMDSNYALAANIPSFEETLNAVLR